MVGISTLYGAVVWGSALLIEDQFLKDLPSPTTSGPFGFSPFCSPLHGLISSGHLDIVVSKAENTKIDPVITMTPINRRREVVGVKYLSSQVDLPYTMHLVGLLRNSSELVVMKGNVLQTNLRLALDSGDRIISTFKVGQNC